MTNDQQQREMKSLKAKPFHEENDDDKIHSHVPSRMKRKLSVDINTEDIRSSSKSNFEALLMFLQIRVPKFHKESFKCKTEKVPDRSYQGVDLTAKARSSPDRSWIADDNITPPKDEGVRSLLPGGGSDGKSPIVPR
ncbi:hypothetical protein E5676_scaffold663G00230 [Cucumis melo var. makuwa]|uniref:Uncharacterized protein n=1 Tax=Cucumis melo var. makuwa TaxID=1194695 RepID=A0A5D3CRV2_CUCMM|nr:hypothetical protein E5676_scaffold663G00230 [Cucumis melo var. makuwa]